MRKKIEYIEPFKSAWEKMVGILFRPFDIRKWFVLGFIAWVACLGDGGGGGGNFNIPFGGGDDKSSNSSSSVAHISDKVKEVPKKLSSMSPEDTKIAVIVLCVLAVVMVVGIAIWLALTWVKARFGFIFLDNVLRNDALISEPWTRFKELGNSSFCWMLSLAFIAFFSLVGTIIIGGVLSILCFINPAYMILGIVVALLFGLLFIVECVALAMLSFFYKHFVIQIMYNQNIRVVAAWKVFYSILKRNIIPFIGYTLIIAGCAIALGTAVLAAGLLTCCIGLLIVSIPYIGTVVLLPTLVFFRLYSVEFFAQFKELS